VVLAMVVIKVVDTTIVAVKSIGLVLVVAVAVIVVLVMVKIMVCSW
jgi:hypothetical protein